MKNRMLALTAATLLALTAMPAAAQAHASWDTHAGSGTPTLRVK